MHKLDQHLFIYHSWQTSNFESTHKKPPFIKVAIFSDEILVSNYTGCKEEVINLTPRYLIHIFYKIVAKAITFRKIAIMPNGTKLMLQVIFISFDWLLVQQIIVSSQPFCLGGNRFSKRSTISFEWGTGAWVKKHRFNEFVGMWTQLIEKLFPRHVGIYKLENI